MNPICHGDRKMQKRRENVKNKYSRESRERELREKERRGRAMN